MTGESINVRPVMTKTGQKVELEAGEWTYILSKQDALCLAYDIISAAAIQKLPNPNKKRSK